MSVNGCEISGHKVSNAFANFFEKKVNDIVGNTRVDDNVYNGAIKLNAQCEMFMTKINIKESIKSIKIKTS